jgi:hypothetical protein
MSEEFTDNVEGAQGASADGAPNQDPMAPDAGQAEPAYDPGVFDTGQDAASPEAFAAGGSAPPPAGDVPVPDLGSMPPSPEYAEQPAMSGLDDAAAAIAASQVPTPPAEPEPTPQAEVQVSAPEPKKTKKKKRKIDLKSRLSSVRATGSMVSASGSVGERKSDPLSFPPPPVSGGVPAPKLAGVSAPLMSSPFAPPEPEKKVSAQAQTIKVEVGEEIHQERAKAKKKTAIYVALAALLMGVIGFFLGGAQERGRRGKKIITEAAQLAEHVATANTTMSDLSDALRNANEQLGQDEFPSALVETLKTTNVDFSADKFPSSIGGLPPGEFNQLLAYTNGVEKLNKQKDVLRNLLGQAKPLVEKYIKEKEKPTVGFAITFSKVEKKDVARLVTIDKPFEVKGDWPAKFTVVSGSGKKKEEAEVSMWDGKGKVTAPKVAIPIDPKTSARFTDLTLLFKLRKAMSDTNVIIDGQDSPVPSQQTDGLLKEGKNLVEGLQKVSRAGG